MNSGTEDEPNWIVRAGIVTAESIDSRSSEHLQFPGLYGFSVQYQPGKTISELAQAGQFPNAQISVTTVEQLVDAAALVGYTVKVVESPGRGFHHTVQLPRPIPAGLAQALSDAFLSMPNSVRYPRRGH